MAESTWSASFADASEFSRRRDIRNSLVAGVAITEMVAIAFSTYFAFVTYHQIVWAGPPETLPYGWISIGLALIYSTICVADKQYDFLGAEWNSGAVHRSVLALCLSFVLLLALMFVSGIVTTYSRGTFIAQLAFGMPVAIAIRIICWRAVDAAHTWDCWHAPGIRIVVFPRVERPIEVLGRWSSRPEEVRHIYHLKADTVAAQLNEIVHDCRRFHTDSVLLLFDGDEMSAVAVAVEKLSLAPVKVQLLPCGIVEFLRCGRIGSFGRAPVIELVSGPRWVADRLLKRTFDLIVAIVAGLLLMPLMLFVALSIKLDSRGPVLFRQTRHGYNNEPISVLKFRTMMQRKDEHQFCQASRDDPRVTRVGRILRRTNMDELPQLLNVIRGEMSLVGPRPHAVSHNQMYDGQIARLSRRHNVKPGITGWAQVNGLRGETDTLEKMRMRIEHDLYYIDHWSFALDMKIVVKTVFSKKSYQNAY
jgi:Undecaprenyl-phosphate glucose phosphotransferase